VLEIFSLYMTSFEQVKTIRVYLPKTYMNENRRYPVLYMHDGQNVFRDEDSIRGVSLGIEDYLDQNDLEIIVVGIDLNTTGEERINEYCPWPNGEFAKGKFGISNSTGGRGEEYLDFIVHELKPFIDRKYRTLDNNTSMAGISLGALITTYAACTYPHIFKKIALLSSGFYRNQEEIENLLGNSDLSAIEGVYMDCGTREAGDEEEISGLFLESSKSVYEILREKVPNTRFDILDNAEHDYAFFRKRVSNIFDLLT
jgi:predicted alpha/beta superfamily hydrolase